MKTATPGTVRAGSSRVFLCAASALAATVAVFGAHRHGPPRLPHVVLVVVDTLRAHNLGAYGYRRPTSPAMDRIAQEGVLFENAVSVGGNTTTAMAGLFTGHYAFFEYGEPWTWYGMRRFGRWTGRLQLPPGMTTVAEYLSSAGYRTAGFITNPYLQPDFLMDQGFGHYEGVFGPNLTPGRAPEVVDRALRYAGAQDWRRPVFLYLHFMDTHGPYRMPRPDVDTGPGLDGRPAHDEAWARWDALQNAGAAEHGPELRYMRASYDAGIRDVDEAVDRLARYLRDRGLLDQTVFVIVADHGEEFLEHGGTGHKGTLFEEIVHVPLIVRAPGGPRGARVPDLVRNFDLAPTLLDYAGLRTPPGMDARSLRPYLEGRGDAVGPTTVYAGFPEVRMLRTDRYKLVRRQDGGELFYDLRGDPREAVDLAGSTDAHIVAARLAVGRALDAAVGRMQREGERWNGNQQSPVLDEVTREQLRALGYTE